MAATSDSLFSYDRELGCRYVCGADEAGTGCWAGPLVAAAVRFDYDRIDSETLSRLADLNDCKELTEGRRAALLPVILDVADVSAVVAASAAEIDRDGPGPSHRRAVARALEAVAVAGSVNLVDRFDLQDAKVSHRAVKAGDRTSAAIAAASIVAKVTRDQGMVELDKQYPGYGFAVHKGYGTPAHATAIRVIGRLSPAHRRSVRSKAYAALDLSPVSLNRPTGDHMPDDVQRIVAAMPPIDDRGPEFRYASMPLCILDAVYSLGEQYPKVQALIRRYVNHYQLPLHRPRFEELPPRDQQLATADLISQIDQLGTGRFASDILCNRRPAWGSRNAPLRSEAVRCAAQVLADHGISVLQDLAGKDTTSVRRALRTVPGWGSSDRGPAYLLMLAGDTSLVKPDRWVLRFIQRTVDRPVSDKQAQLLLAGVAEALGVTATEVDYTIWASERAT